MVNDQALIVRDDARRKVSFTQRAKELMQAALEAAALVFRVASPSENEAAVEAQKRLKDYVSLIEGARKAAKQPVWDFGCAIDAAAKAMTEEVRLELLRVSKLAGDFMALEEAKRRAAEAAARAELEAQERERQKALAEVKSHEEREAVVEKFDAQARSIQEAIPVPLRAEGQRVVTEPVIESIREWELARARPDLVRRIEFDLVAVKAALKRGDKLPGVKWHEETKALVAGRKGPLIEV